MPIISLNLAETTIAALDRRVAERRAVNSKIRTRLTLAEQEEANALIRAQGPDAAQRYVASVLGAGYQRRRASRSAIANEMIDLVISHEVTLPARRPKARK